MEPSEKCPKCGAVYGKGAGQVCGRCGWDSQIGMRKCIKCQGAVVIHERPGYGPMGGLAGLTGFIFWFFFGLLLGGAIASFSGAVCGLITLLTLSYACTGCNQKVESRLMDAEEKEAFKKRRMAYLLGSVGLAVLAVALVAARIGLFVHRMNSLSSGS
jgi:hypothetical protein